MANRVFSRGRAPRRASSLKTWAGFTSGTTWSALSSGTATIVGSFVAGADLTVLRTRGMLSILSDAEVEEEVDGAIGLAIVSEDAFQAGITAVPTPIGDIDSDSWLLWQPFQHARALGTAAGQSPANSQYPLDSKAMRKFHADERVVVVLENGSSVFALRFHLIARMLVRTGAGA